MFLRASFVSIILLLFISLVWFKNFCHVTKEDYVIYRQLKDKGATDSSSNSLYSSSTHQIRYGVHKEIWVSEEETSRLQYRIESDSSTLTLVPKNDKMEVIENLHGIKCMMQDKLYFLSPKKNPMQQTRFLEAETGSYEYKTQKFVAEAVTLSIYRLPGHTLPVSLDDKIAFLRGLAQNVSFGVSGKAHSFQATHFKAFLRKGDL